MTGKRLLLSMLAAAFCHAADFSHELHLKLIPACTGCHNKATTSTEPADNLLPGFSTCARCHKDIPAIKQPRAIAVSKFSHAFHAKLGPAIAPMIAQVIDKKRYLSTPEPDLRRHLDTKNPCGGCHRGLEESKSVAAANHFPHMADCLVCHNRIDPPDSCATCHSPSSVQFKPANHSPDFLDRHTTGKIGLDKTTCAVCHGRNFTCLGCH